MNNGATLIPLLNLALAAVPLAVLLVVMWRWSAGPGGALYAIARMLLQLILIGYALTWIFVDESALVVSGVLVVMLSAASWIALRPVEAQRRGYLVLALVAIAAGGCFTLALITGFVLEAKPWYQPRLVIPLAGMIFASSMNAVSIAAERYTAERNRAVSVEAARQEAFSAAMIPLLNSLLAVGLVSLPGMMTGQILAGVDPLIAVRYQIMVMLMLTGAAGLSAALFLTLLTRRAT